MTISRPSKQPATRTNHLELLERPLSCAPFAARDGWRQPEEAYSGLGLGGKGKRASVGLEAE